MKPLHNKRLIIFSFIIITLLGICLPGILLHTTFSSRLNTVNNVPEELYKNSNSAISRNASSKLTESERMKIISGSWDSSEIQVDPSQSSIGILDAVELAKNVLSELYTADIYPYLLNSSYDNWYSWDASFYQCTENSFHTYSAYYWKVSFYRYNTNEVHDILITENGTVLAVRNNMPDETLAKLKTIRNSNLDDLLEASFPKTKNRLLLKNVSTEISLPVYKNIEIEEPAYNDINALLINCPQITSISDLETADTSALPDNAELYWLYQCYNESYYMMCMIPIY